MASDRARQERSTVRDAGRAHSLDAGSVRDLDHARAGGRPLDPGRLGMYAVLGGASGAVPLPWVPDALTRRVRGALAHDIARRHGVRLPGDAREVLAEPSGTEGPRGMLRHVGGFVALKLLARMGPLAALPPVKAGLETFVLGHLLHRYFDTARPSGARALDVVEARRVRHAIDGALVAALTVDVPAVIARVAPGRDERDAFTAALDDLLARAGGLPADLLRRIDAAFDERLPPLGE